MGKRNIKKAFTLAEIMVVLTIIGILTAILLPSAFRNTPDENIMKFKKANNTLAMVIGELVSNGKYYCIGDLGLKPDCATKMVDDETNRVHLCRSIADIMSTKSVNCNTTKGGSKGSRLLSNQSLFDIATGSPMKLTVTAATITATKTFFDTACKSNAATIGAEITTTDDVVYYQTQPDVNFGSWLVEPNSNNGLSENIRLRYFSPPGQHPANYADQNGMDISYKIFCMDIDGIGTGEDPFGYGIRADGKIMNGTRADAWVKLSVQQKD